MNEKTVRDIFQVAERNRAASERLVGEPELFGPRITLVALAIELYLKTLLAANNLKHKGLHDHVELFRKLPAKAKASIRSRYDAEVAKPEVVTQIVAVMMRMPAGVKLEFDFDSNLAHGSSAFIRWRYSYEGDVPEMPTCYEICEALRQELISEFPDLPVIASTGERFLLLKHRG